jgi:uncharacterized membrane protein HdeD (DUF308 family)
MIIVAISSIITTSIIANIFHKNPALKEAHRNNYNYIMMNLMLSILFLFIGIGNFCIANIDRTNYTFNENTLFAAAGVFGLVIGITSVSNCSIGLQVFNSQPDLIVNNPNSYNYIMMNLVLAVMLILGSLFCVYKFYDTRPKETQKSLLK